VCPTDLDGDRSTTAIHINQLRLTNESALYSLGADPSVEDRASVATIREAELLKQYMTQDSQPYVVNGNIGFDLLQGIKPSATFDLGWPV